MANKVYISGCISNGDKLSSKEIAKNKELFYQAEKWVNSIHGLEFINPLRIKPDGDSWEDYMIADIRELFKCTHIMMLPGWEKSKGARIERAIAFEIGLEFI